MNDLVNGQRNDSGVISRARLALCIDNGSGEVHIACSQQCMVLYDTIVRSANGLAGLHRFAAFRAQC